MTRFRIGHGWNRAALASMAACALMLGGCGDGTGEGSNGDGSERASGAGEAGTGAGDEGSGVLGSPETRVVQRVSVGDYVARVRRAGSGEDQLLELVRGGRVVLSRRAAAIAIEPAAGSPSSAFEQGTDATGDGTPNLIFHEHTGGEGCCYTFVVLSLGRVPEIVATLDAGRGEAAFNDVNDDGIHEFVGRDWTLADWLASESGAASGDAGDATSQAAPRIVQRYEDGVYLLAPDLMAEPAPEQAELESTITDVLKASSWDEGQPPAAYWGGALELIYVGHPDVAENFLRWAWAPGVAGREGRVEAFRERLAESPYYSSLSE